MIPAMPTDLAIARAASPLPIDQIAKAFGVPEGLVEPYRRNKAKPVWPSRWRS